MSRRFLRISTLAAVASLGAVGCDDEPKVDADQADAGPEGPVLGGKIGEAVAAAEAAGDAGAKPAAVEEGPPPRGIFDPGAADAKHRAGAEPTVEVLDQGAEPRFTLQPARADGPQSLQLTLAIRTGQPGFPPLKLGLRVAPQADGEKAEGESPSPSADRDVAVELRSIEVVGAETMALPKQVTEALDSLKGSVIQLKVRGNGPAETSFKLADKGEAGLENVVRATMDVVSSLWLPVPSKPVGAGGYWMVTDRLPSFGVDVVRYRVFKVESIDDKSARLSVDVRQYATSDAIALPETKNVTLAQYDHQGNGKLVYSSAGVLPESAEILVRTQALLAPPGAKNQGAQMQVAPMQIEVQGELATAPAGARDEAPKKGAPPSGP